MDVMVERLAGIDLQIWLEIWGVLTGIAYVWLATRENIWCWFFGLVSSVLSIILFVRVGLLAEAGLYGYYVLASFYGWWSWQHPARSKKTALSIRQWPVSTHLVGIPVVALIGLLLGWGLDAYTSAVYPWADAQTTVFSFWATFLTARKALENWMYWIVIDLCTAGLYASRDLYFYAGLMVLYTGMAAWGYLNWKKILREEKIV